MGVPVIHSSVPIVQKRAFARALRAELFRGQYEILHCHHDLVSALYLVASTGTPVRRRIVHVHNASEHMLTPSILKQHIYREATRRFCLAFADQVVGISNHTLDTFLAGRSRRPGCDFVHYCGIDTGPFLGASPDRTAFRRELGLPEDALIVLFAGRVVSEKNPTFAVDVLAAMRCIEARAVAVFAGAGAQEEDVTRRACELGVHEHVRVLGWRHDVAQIMRSSDWFILPRLEYPKEGFGIAVVEAQLAGLPMLLSLGIVDDPLLPTAVFRRLSLSAPATAWAEAAIELLKAPPPAQADVLAAHRQSPMDMDRALDDFITLHACRN